MTNTVEQSVVMAMDGSDSHLFPYLPYILQDVWEMGASSKVVLKLVEQHATDYSNLKVLDLGCGKGAVLIKLAKAFNCHCHGIDAVEEFIEQAKSKAKAFHVDEYCYFECDDIRARVTELKGYNIIILGAIGPVLGGYHATLTKLSSCIKEGGFVIIDDAYIGDGSDYSHPLMEKKSEILKQSSDAGMKLIDEIILSKDEVNASDEYLYQNIKKRCQELIEKYPSKRKLFIDYINKQEEENEVLEQKVICSTMLFGK